MTPVILKKENVLKFCRHGNQSKKLCDVSKRWLVVEEVKYKDRETFVTYFNQSFIPFSRIQHFFAYVSNFR